MEHPPQVQVVRGGLHGKSAEQIADSDDTPLGGHEGGLGAFLRRHQHGTSSLRVELGERSHPRPGTCRDPGVAASGIGTEGFGLAVPPVRSGVHVGFPRGWRVEGDERPLGVSQQVVDQVPRRPGATMGGS